MANEMGKRYSCEKCGTVMLVTRPGKGMLTCCGVPMPLRTGAPKPEAAAPQERQA